LRIAFFIYDFVPAKLPLQPWLTVLRVAEYLHGQGHDVHVVTDARDAGDLEGMTVHRVASLRGSNSGEVDAVIRDIGPDRCVVLITPLNLVTSAWYRSLGEIGAYAFASYTFYTAAEIVRALRRVEPGVVRSYARHLLVPRILWAGSLARHFRGVICQSQTSRDRLADLTRNALAVHAIMPGIDRQLWSPPAGRDAGDGGDFLYVGAATRIRGFHVALDAMAMLGDPGIRLRVLARGSGGGELAAIQKQVELRGLGDRVSVAGGWLEQPDLVREIRAAKAVLLPFVLVPSELPVSVMEAIACGTPVIASDIDGLPSTVGDAGLLVRQGDAADLARAIGLLHGDGAERERRRDACVAQAQRMPSWDRMCEQWETVLSSDD